MLNGTIFLIFSACLVVYLIVLTIYFIKLRRHYNRLISFSGKESLGKILDTVLDKLSDNRNDIQALKKNIDELTETGRNHVQKVGIVRYNPFKDKGFDQSFILAILDNKDKIIIIDNCEQLGYRFDGFISYFVKLNFIITSCSKRFFRWQLGIWLSRKL